PASTAEEQLVVVLGGDELVEDREDRLAPAVADGLPAHLEALHVRHHRVGRVVEGLAAIAGGGERGVGEAAGELAACVGAVHGSRPHSFTITVPTGSPASAFVS